MARRYEFVEGSSSKFWEIALEGASFTARWGRLGTDGQEKTQDFDSPAEAKKAHDKLCAEKEKKGYRLVGSGGDDGPAPMAVTSKNPDLEAKIAADPENDVPWKIYADWLIEKGEPWGEVIARATGGKPDTKKQKDAEAAITGGIDGADFTWKHGVVEEFSLISEDEPEEENTAELVLQRLLAHPAGRLVRKLTLGLPPRVGGDIDWHYDGMIEAMVTAGPLPLLESLDMSPDADHMDQPSWRRIGDLRKLWKMVPRLKELKLQGARGSDDGTPVRLGDLQLPNLETFVFQSGGLDGSVPKDLGSASLPKLKHLELWFGREDYGNDGSVESLAGILSGKGLPALKTLGLMNSEWGVELIDAIAGSAILPRLEVLDLSMGTLYTDEAAALIKHAKKFAHLKKLDVSDNFLPDEKALKAVLPNVEFGEQKEPDVDGEDVYRYSTVGE